MGGIETHVHEVGRCLVRNGVDVTLLTTPPPNLATALPKEEEVEGMHVMRVPAWQLQQDYYIAPGYMQLSNVVSGISFTYPLIQMFRFTKTGSELVDRAAAFLFIPIATMLAIFITQM